MIKSVIDEHNRTIGSFLFGCLFLSNKSGIPIPPPNISRMASNEAKTTANGSVVPSVTPTTEPAEGGGRKAKHFIVRKVW
jgi:hypothetical protein